MLDGVSSAFNTALVATPYVGGTVGLYVFMYSNRGNMVANVIGGAIMGGMMSGAWEMTVNSKQNTAIKTEVIMGSAAIGAGAGAVASVIKGF